MPKLPETTYFGLAPDWICQTISTSTERYDKGEKRDIYARHDVRHLWLLDPTNRVLETFELRHGLWVLLRTWRDDDEVAAPPFDAVPFKLGLLWAE